MHDPKHDERNLVFSPVRFAFDDDAGAVSLKFIVRPTSRAKKKKKKKKEIHAQLAYTIRLNRARNVLVNYHYILYITVVLVLFDLRDDFHMIARARGFHAVRDKI